MQPRLQVAESPASREVMEEAHQTELHQQISNMMTERVMGLTDVGIEFP